MVLPRPRSQVMIRVATRAVPTVYTSQQDTPDPHEDDSSGPLMIGASLGLALLVVLAFIRWRKRPLPIERLPEVARRQRMKGL